MARVTIARVLVNMLVVSIILVDTMAKNNGKETPKIQVPGGFDAMADTEIADIHEIETLLNEAKNSLPAIIAFWANPAVFGMLLSRRVCSSEPNVFSGLFNVSKSTLLNKLIASEKKLLSSIIIPETPSISGGMYDEYTHISNFKMNNLKLNGLEKLIITKFNIDMCTMSVEFEMKIPKIDITGTYNIGGVIEGSPVSGNGEIKASFHNIYVYDRSFSNCESVVFMDHPCIVTERIKKTTFTTSDETVYLSGLIYGSITNETIVNNILKSYIHHKKPELLKKMTSILVDYKKKILKYFTLESLIEKLQESMKRFPTMMDKVLRSAVQTRKTFGFISILLTLL